MNVTVNLTDDEQARRVLAELAAITLKWGDDVPEPITDKVYRVMQRAKAQYGPAAWSPVPELCARKAWLESKGWTTRAVWHSLTGL